MPGNLQFQSTVTNTWVLSGKIYEAPDTYVVRVGVSDGALTTYTYDTICVKQENAEITYTGPEYFTLPSTTATTMKILLSATVKDITAVDPSSDPNPGVITNAIVEFHRDTKDGVLLGTAVVELVDPSDSKVGIASKLYDVQLSNTDLANGGLILNIVPVVKGYYTALGDVQGVTVALPGSEFVTGGGYLVNNSTKGTFAAKQGGKTNFGFTMKYTKTGTNLKGQANIIVRSINRIYHIKSNAINTLSVGAQTAAGTPAYFTTKANYTYTDITDPLNPVTYPGAGNLDLTIRMNDFSNGGQGDQVSILLMNGSTMLFSSNWNGTQTILQNLGGGNVSVRNTSTSTTSIVTTRITKESISEVPSAKFNLQAYPNPARSQFTVKIESDNVTEKVHLRVYDLNGRTVQQLSSLSANQTITLGSNYRPGVYFVEMVQGKRRMNLKLIKTHE